MLYYLKWTPTMYKFQIKYLENVHQLWERWEGGHNSEIIPF